MNNTGTGAFPNHNNPNQHNPNPNPNPNQHNPNPNPNPNQHNPSPNQMGAQQSMLYGDNLQQFNQFGSTVNTSNLIHQNIVAGNHNNPTANPTANLAANLTGNSVANPVANPLSTNGGGGTMGNHNLNAPSASVIDPNQLFNPDSFDFSMTPTQVAELEQFRKVGLFVENHLITL